MRLLAFYTTLSILNTTICSMSDLSIMKSSSLGDLLLDECKCVHLSSPEVVGFLVPVPSVVCVPWITVWCRFLYGLNQFNLPLCVQILMLINPKDYSISIWTREG
jgi:hypothetical protein